MARNRQEVKKAQGGASKQSISTGSNSQEFALLMMDFILRKILTFHIHIKLAIYFLAVTITSVIGDVAKPGAIYFSNKHNIFNQYFVKLGWGWTFSVVGALMLLSVLISNKGEVKNFLNPIVRLTFMSVYWYICTHSFEWLEDITGSCTNTAMTSKRPCLRDGHNWLGFDISGHSFLLVHCLLFLNEEAQVILSLSKSLDQLERTERSAPSPTLATTYRFQLRIITIALLFFTLLWEFMLFITALYFHTSVQKIVGMIIAMGGWVVVYKLLKLSPQSAT